MSIRSVVNGAGIIGAGPAKAHSLSYAKKVYATIKATAETVGLQLA